MLATQVAATALPSPQTAPHLHLQDRFVSVKYFINTKEKSVCLLFKQLSTHILKLSTCLFFFLMLATVESIHTFLSSATSVDCVGGKRRLYYFKVVTLNCYEIYTMET